MKQSTCGKNVGYQKTSVRKRIHKYKYLYLLALPSIVYLFINNYMPMTGLKITVFQRGYFKVSGVD